LPFVTLGRFTERIWILLEALTERRIAGPAPETVTRIPSILMHNNVQVIDSMVGRSYKTHNRQNRQEVYSGRF
jgi:hypothetical protein